MDKWSGLQPNLSPCTLKTIKRYLVKQCTVQCIGTKNPKNVSAYWYKTWAIVCVSVYIKESFSFSLTASKKREIRSKVCYASYSAIDINHKKYKSSIYIIFRLVCVFRKRQNG